MGRSKFPGKPPKTVTRKRIKVLGRPEATQSDSVTVAENIYYGLSLFNETFGDSEKEHRPFHGFSSNEAKLSVTYMKTQNHDSENKNCELEQSDFNGSNDDTNIIKENVQNLDENIDVECKNDENKTKNLSKDTKINLNNVDNVDNDNNDAHCSENDNKKLNNNCNKSKISKDVKFKRVIRAPILKSVNNILDCHQRTRQLRNSTAKRLLQRAKFNVTSNNRNITVQSSDKSNAIKKFILPMRSAHSSRVIKPNKRFIEELEQSPSIDAVEHDNKQSKKVKLVKNNKSKVKGNIVRGNNKNPINSSTKSNSKLNSVKNNKVSVKDSGEGKKSNLLSKIKVSSNNSESNANNSIKQTSESTDANSIFESSTSKVLPDLNAPIVESSRIKTRSRIPSDAAVDAENTPVNQINIKENKKINGSTLIACPKLTQSDNNEDAHSPCDTSLENFDETESSMSESTSEQSNNSEDEHSEWTGMKLDGGKIILRKARLKLENKSSGGPEGPFSVTNIHNNSNGNLNPSLTGTVKCGVCGAVRFYRFVKQARKFGIYSCESCRKFISKIIKRQACAKSTNSTLPILQCHKGDGLCLVPPVVRSQQWNLMRCAYKARCPACWLKMCLKCYNIPTTIKAGLNNLLPPLLRDPVLSLGSLNQDNEVLGQKTVGSKINWPAEDCLEKNLFKSAINLGNIQRERKLGYQSGGSQGPLSSKFNKSDHSITMSLSKKRKKDTRIKVRKKMKNPHLSSPSPLSSSAPLSSANAATTNGSSPSATTNNASASSSSTSTASSSQPLRQRVDLKGPRVKHVCRSASVALGQPIATFPANDEKEESDATNKTVLKVVKDEDKNAKINDTREKVSNKSNQENNANSNNNIVQQTYVKRSKVQTNILPLNSHGVRTISTKSGLTNKIHEISMDFWEQYDPTEVGAKGFALIASEMFTISAICFLCGSAGKEPLIHCQCCCEPYHAYCLEPSEWNACIQPDWCCPRCTICQTCNQRTGPKLSCIRCRQSFHHLCLSKSGVNARLYSPDRPYICQNCVKCKSCGSEGVNVYVGNLPLCSMCFKLRQRGNYCPLCQRCYNENDFNTKMMECNECSCWVHAHCEGLSDEFYQILSYLPDSIEFTCSQCSPNFESPWRIAIEKELKAGFVAVLKSLSKNRKVCNALNWSPRKECLCKPIVSVRKLDFSDDKFKKELGNEESEVETNEKNSSSTTFAADKVDPLSRFDFEVDDQQVDIPRRGLRKLKQKFHLKECSVRVKKCALKDANDTADTNSNPMTPTNTRECQCLEEQIIMKPSASLMSVKRKVNNNEYQSLFQFHCDMEHVVDSTSMQDLVTLYHKSLQEIFPWFDPKQSTITSYDNELSPSKRDTVADLDSSISKLNDSILETWKEEVAKASKAINLRAGSLYSNVSSVEDTRSCALCKGLGDGQETREGRLLYCGQNEWAHANCALWSNEVFEEIDGSLQNVHSAISRGRMIRCTECSKKGASVGCCAKNCGNTFHFPCARNAGLGLHNDKTIYCSLHLSNSNNNNQSPPSEEDFSLKRLVYVELERKKKKFVEPDKIKIMIGSLLIDCLGAVVPEFSDTPDKIIPNNYKCSRLYWSTINPVKIVKYYVRTYIKTCTTDINLDMDHNVTIDHSKEREKEERLRFENLVVKQTLDTLIDSVYNREMDENLAEQNNTDLLPPEITDVIFEDLPHDLLDGISMQDIFPKMSYEDFLAMDLKSDAAFGNDILKDEMLSSEVDEIIKSSENKMSKENSLSDVSEQSDVWFHLETKSNVQDLVDDILSSKTQKFGGKELKRSKSEVLSNNSINSQRRHHQRSCSLTWSCKLDGTYGPTVKRRKLSRPSTTAITGELNSFVVDTSSEKNSMFHDLRIPESIMVTVGRTNSSPNTIPESVRDKRLIWHTRQQPRMLQVDGIADPSSSSECSSPEYDIEEKLKNKAFNNQESSANAKYLTLSNDGQKVLVKEEDNNSFLESFSSDDDIKIPQLDGADDISSDDENPHYTAVESTPYVPIVDPGDRPVTCKRCQCTYRTHDSYNRHLANCDIVTTSDSDSETIDNKGASPISRFSDNINSLSPQFITLSSPSEGHTLSSEFVPDMQVTSPLEASVPSPHAALQIEPTAQALISPQIHRHVETVHQTVLTSNDVIVQTQYTRTTTTLPTNSPNSSSLLLPAPSSSSTSSLSLSNPSQLSIASAAIPQESSIKITEVTDTNLDQMSPSPTSSSKSSAIQTVSSPHALPAISVNDGNNCLVVVASDVEETQSNHQQASTIVSKVLKPKSVRAPKSKVKLIKPQIMKNTIAQQVEPVRYQTIQNASPVVQLQQAQRPAAPTVILQQVPPSGIMSAYVDTLQQQSDQNLQYITTIGGQDTAYKPQFISTNQLVPGAYIHTATSDNLLALSNGGISVLPGVQIAQPQPTVLGTIIQQQPNAIQCGVISSEQLVLSSAPTLEMFTDSTGSMFVSSQPMYYGLETIVSNTVMSSSQFVAGAVPQVLASSYQTTTQVFQASKLMEPIVDVQTMQPSVSTVQAVPGISNVPTVQTVQSVPPNVQNLPNVQTVQSIQSIPAVQSVSNIHGGYVVVNPTTPEAGITTAQINVNTSANIQTPTDQTNFDRLPVQSLIEPVRAKLHIHEPEVHSVAPFIDIQSRSIANNSSKPTQLASIPRIAVRPSPVSQQIMTSQPNCGQWKLIPEPLYGVERAVNNNTRPYLDSKHVSENTSMIKSSISTKVPPLSNHCVTQRDIVKKFNCDVNNIHDLYCNTGLSSNGNFITSITQNNSSHNKIVTSVAPTTRPMNRVLPMQAVAPKQETVKSDIIDIEEPTKPVTKPLIPETIQQPVKPINITESIDKSLTTTDKLFYLDKPSDENLTDITNAANDILFDEKLLGGKEKCEVIDNEKLIPEAEKPAEKIFEKEVEGEVVKKDVGIEEEVKSEAAVVELNQESGLNHQELGLNHKESQLNHQAPGLNHQESELNHHENQLTTSELSEKIGSQKEKEKLQNASLKIVLQKQLQDGSYKITHNIKPKNSPKITSVEILPSKQTPHIASLQLLPIKKFTLKTNKLEDEPRISDSTNIPKSKVPPVSVKPSRFLSKSTTKPAKTNPLSVNTQKKTEPRLMYEIKSQDGFVHTASSMAEVWESVFQAVQAARKAHNLPPLTHNPLTENLGLDNNATIYLVEQLDGVNRCTKYKPKYHNLSPPKSFDSDTLSESDNGAARAEPFKGRKAHDMFSWLASRHRQQPKIIALSETDIRRAASTNLPMAMRFRMLKETSKESVGVYHSHIHGRGLFCLRDIEAGEMVIEYAGEVIRASLTDKREKYYDSKNIGCYMFKIDDHLVVDATMKGNAARFINHSCEPNCYSKVVDILGKKHILIFALRRINQGEELTYDYKFPFEDVKIPCTCGSRKCRKYLN